VCVYIFTVAAIDQYYSAQANNLQFNLDKHNSGSSASNKYGIPNSLLKRIIGGPVFYLAFWSYPTKTQGTPGNLTPVLRRSEGGGFEPWSTANVKSSCIDAIQ